MWHLCLCPQKFIYIITQKVYASRKAKNTLYDSKLHTAPKVIFTYLH